MSKCTLGGRRRHDRDEQGFSLVELVVVLVIMPVIIGAIAFGLVSVFQLQNSTSQRLSGSVDLQKVSAQFTKDVQDSEHVYLGVTPQQCGTVGTQLLGLGWNYGNGSDQSMVSYVRIAMKNNSSNYLLERLYCTLGNMTTPTATTVLSADFYVSSGLLVQNPPSVCVSNLQNCVTNTSTSYNSHDLAAVTFTMYVPMSSSAYTMVVSPRGGTSPDTGSANGGPTAGITLLGACTGGTNTVLSVGNGNLNIETLNNGQGTGTLGLVNCPASAVSLANNGSIDASGVLTGQQSTTGISVGANPGTYPTQVTTDTGLCNWLQSSPYGCATISNPLVAPTTWNNTTKCGNGGLPECGNCVTTTGTNNQYTYTCTSGIYPTTPSFKNGAIINLTGTSDGTSSGTPGVTLFQSDFTVPNGGSLSFSPNEAYVFAAPDAGAFSTGTSNKKTDGIYISGTNVLLYVPTGGMTLSNNTFVQLTGSPSNDYVDMWVNGQLNSPANGDGVLTLGNNSTSTATNTFGGIYVPYGEVVDSNNGTISASFILAGSASFSNGLTVTITGY
jgi:prepilin-type N-terminal cleavage/methylation domain-containing protein